MSSLLTKLVRKSMLQQAPGNHTAHLQVLLQRHAEDAHESWHRPIAPHAIPEEMIRHAKHPVWQDVRHSGRRQMTSWLRQQQNALPASDVSSGLDFSKDNATIGSELVGRDERRLSTSYWSFLPNLEDYTLTFLDLVIQHPPQGTLSRDRMYPIM